MTAKFPLGTNQQGVQVFLQFRQSHKLWPNEMFSQQSNALQLRLDQSIRRSTSVQRQCALPSSPSVTDLLVTIPSAQKIGSQRALRVERIVLITFQCVDHKNQDFVVVVTLLLTFRLYC